MAGRQRQNERYDFSSARDRAAFEALMAEEDEEEEGYSRSAGPQHLKRGARGAAGKQKREKEKFFALRDPHLAAAAGSSAASKTDQDVQQLQDLFGGSADGELIAAVYEQCGRSLAAAVEALLGLFGDQAAEQDRGEGSGTAITPGASSSSPWAPRAGPSNTAATAAASWEVLPRDMRSSVLGKLSLRDMARAAATCREWDTWCCAQQRAVTRLVLQPGLSYAAVRGCIARCQQAAVVDLSRLERAGHRLTTSSPSAVAEVARLQRGQAEAELFRVVLALAEGLTRPRAVPLRGLVASGLMGVTDAVVTEVLRGMLGLRSLDLSHCPNLTTQALLLLSKYRVADNSSAAAAADSDTHADKGPTHSAAAAAAAPATSSTTAAAPAEAPVVTAAASSSPQAAADPAAAGDREGSGGTSTTSSGVVSAALGQVMAADIAALTLNQQQQEQQKQTVDAATTAAAAGGGGGSRPSVKDTGGLHSLVLAGNNQLADFGVAAVLGGATSRGSLQHVDVSHCKGLSSDALQLPPTGVLQQLVARGLGPGLKALSVQLPSSHPLQVLDLSGCAYLRELNLVTPHLTSLHLNKAATLHQLRLNCPRLTHLSATHCTQLAVLFEDTWSTPALQHLNLFGCRALHQVHHVLRGCSALASLNCNGCTALTQLLLRDQPLLADMDVSGCGRLMVLEVESPALQRCHASSCGHMQRLLLGSTRLTSLLLTNCQRLSQVVVMNNGPGAEEPPAAGERRISLRGCGALAVADKSALKRLVGAA